MKTTNKNASYYANNQIDFQGSNLIGEWISDSYVFNFKKVYIIKSYQTIMAAFIDGKWLINKRKYSRTTSKQVNALNLPCDKEFIDDYTLKNFISSEQEILSLTLNLSLSNNNQAQPKKIKI